MRISVYRARAGRVTGWIIDCERCGVIGDPTARKWTKNQAATAAHVHARRDHPMERCEVVG